MELENDTKNSITEEDVLSVYCSIVMKEGAAGTASPETAGSSSLIQIDSVYPKDADTATVDFSLNGQDRESLRLLREMLYAEGYQNHAKLLEKY